MLLSYIAYIAVITAMFCWGSSIVVVLNAQQPSSWSFRALRYAPVTIDLLLVISVFTLGADSYDSHKWAVYPVEMAFPVLLVCHLALILAEREKTRFIGYTAMHLPGATLIWISCYLVIAGK